VTHSCFANPPRALQSSHITLIGGELRYLDTCFTSKITFKNWLQLPTQDSRIKLPISINKRSAKNHPFNWRALPTFGSLILICSLMQIKIRQRYRVGATLRNCGYNGWFFYFPLQLQQSEIHTSTRDQNFHGTKPHPPKSGHCSQTSASADLPPSTTSPWLPIQPGTLIHQRPHALYPMIFIGLCSWYLSKYQPM
jgi:hypothetical protein